MNKFKYAQFILPLFIGLLISACGASTLSYYESSGEKISEQQNSPRIDSMVQPYKVEMEKMMNEVIGYTDSALTSFKPESPLSNFIADVIFETGYQFAQNNKIAQTESDFFCLLNFGGIRTSLNQGNITRGDIFEIMPFDNTLVIVEIKTEKMTDLMMYLDTMMGQPVSHIHFFLSDTLRTFEFQNESEKIQAIRQSSYYVITSDYLANGGDKMNFLTEPIHRWDTGILVRDALINWIEKNKTIPYLIEEGRMEIE